MTRCNCFQREIWFMVLVSNSHIDGSRNSCDGGKRRERNMIARCVSYTGGRLPKPGSVNWSWLLFQILALMDSTHCDLNNILLFVVQSTTTAPTALGTNLKACFRQMNCLWIGIAGHSNHLPLVHPVKVTVSDTDWWAAIIKEDEVLILWYAL